jgi:hypothetical protein
MGSVTDRRFMRAIAWSWEYAPRLLKKRRSSRWVTAKASIKPRNMTCLSSSGEVVSAELRTAFR